MPMQTDTITRLCHKGNC